jgi:DNA-binding SARP family transcriptional activator/pimeloyl-ACP methyl ester carboxylesterase
MWKLTLFGTPKLERDGRSLHIPRRKSRALLAYLAVTQQSHSREALAALFWPEYSQRDGRADLSRNLSTLRKTIGADCFLVDRESVALNEQADLWIDVIHFRRQLDICREITEVELDEDCCQKLAGAVDCYQADFLAGFTLPDCPAFDEWQLLQTEALRRDLGWAFGRLVHAHEARNDLHQAIVYAQRWVGLDPLHEPAQRRLIALYTRNGQRAEAHRQYQLCERLLAEELGVEPQPETKQLYEQTLRGGFKSPLIANRFQLLEQEDNLLGRGNIGEVYQGLDTKLDRPVAIKVTRPGVTSRHPDLLDRFVREGKALSQLDHPNIVKMIAAIVENDRHYLIMEYVSGGSLQDLLARSGPLSLPAVLEIALGLADALARAHHLNIIHRDLKPANVLLADDGTPRLTDFGLALLGNVSHLTQAGTLLGTIGYISPEACQGETLDARSDVWSLGVLLVEMLTGEHPFRGPSPAATITAILNQPTPDLRQRYPHIPVPLVDLIGRMLVKERQERLSSMRLIGAELEAIQHGPSLVTLPLPKKLEQEIKYFFSYDNVRIAYAIVGNGPPLVWTATFLRHLEFDWQSPIWQHWLEALASRYTLIRYDERGCGLSDWNVSDISFEAWVRDLEALVDHLGLERFSLMALSQAGAVAIAYAARHPERLSHLVLHGAYARGRFHRQDIPQAPEEAKTLLSLTKLGWGRDNPAFRQVFSIQLMPDATREQLAWYDELMRVSMTPENAVRAETEMYNINVLDLLPEVSVPTLVTHCHNDEAVPFSEGRILASQIPGARFVPLDSKNHLLLPSEPAWEQFVRQIHRFVATESQSFSKLPPTDRPAAARIPRFYWPEPHPIHQHPFVGRSQELARLNNYLDEALTANGRVVFVTGGAGRGKTSLLEEFARHAQEMHPDLIIAGGSGSTLAGVGDPYLPFREVMELLTGNVTTRRIGRQADVEQARRLWGLLPQTTQAILEYGPQLLDIFVSGKQLLARATAVTPAGVGWLAALSTEVARHQNAPGALEQTALIGQFTNVLHHLAQKRPLLITFDDIQWIDEASLGLLFHLGRRLAGSRLLIVGAYRPDELARGRNDQPHPLVQVLNEFKRIYGDVFIDLARADETDGKAFIDAFLDSEPNQLDLGFRQALFQRTEGHPLFVVELLRDMQSRGDLVQDEAGRWREAQVLDWEMFPARVEAVIARRVDRLDDASRAILRAASVEGELFTAEVVAQVLGMADQPLLHSLSQHLGKQHRLVRERGEIKAGQGFLSSYQFSHALFQQYLYRQLSQGERRRLHGAVAGALATLYGEDLDQVIVQLAHHYTAAADWPVAVKYQSRAGDLAYQRASLPDAARHYKAALAHWPQSDNTGQAEILHKLGQCLWHLGWHQEAIETLQTSHDLFHGAGDNQGAATAQRLLGRVYWESGQLDKAGRCYRQALDLLEGEPENEALAWALASMSNYHMHLGNYEESINLGEWALALARRLSADALIIQCLCDLGSAISSRGNWEGLALEQESLELALASNRPHDAGRAYQYIAEGLIYLGRYDQARALLEDAIAYTQRMHVQYIAEGAARMLAEVDHLTGRWSAAIKQLKPMINGTSSEQPADLFQIYVGLILGRLYNDLGLVEEAHKLLTRALAGPVNSLDPCVALLGELARAEALRGRPEAVAAATREILNWTGQAGYLFPNTNMALLLICRLPVAFGLPAMVRSAHSAQQQLERLDRQYSTLATAACLLEGKGWLALAEAKASEAVASFKQAAAKWQELVHPYDQARALSGMRQALIQTGDRDGAKLVSERAADLISALAMQLDDPELKSSFLNSPLVSLLNG